MTILSQRQMVYGARNLAVDTKRVELTHSVNGLITQEDANHHFADRIEALEAGGGALTEIDGGTY